jgi:hypothetical protein
MIRDGVNIQNFVNVVDCIKNKCYSIINSDAINQILNWKSNYKCKTLIIKGARQSVEIRIMNGLVKIIIRHN